MENVQYDNKAEKFDTVVETVVNRIKDRARLGLSKYGTDLDRKDLTVEEWLDHAIEESMDFCLYLTKLKQNFKNKL